MFSSQELVNQKDGLRKFAMKLTRNAAEADDLLQNTLVRSLEKAELFQDGTNLFRWASRIMFRLYLDDLRRRKFSTQYDAEGLINARSYEGPQESLADIRAAREAMKLLSEESRQILRLVCFEDRSYSEAASVLNIPLGTVRSRLSRARESLDIVLATNSHASGTHVLGSNKIAA